MHTFEAVGTVAYLKYKNVIYIMYFWPNWLSMQDCALCSNCLFSLNLNISELKQSPGKIVCALRITRNVL